MASTSTILRKKRHVYLIGSTLDSINGSKLPSNRRVLARFLHLHTVEHQTVSASASATAEELMQFWDKARIPTRLKCHIISSIRDLHAQWVSLKKNSSRQTDTQHSKEEAMKETFADLFNVAHANALTLIKIKEDRAFLLAQREKGRRGNMGSVDTVLAKKEKRCKLKLLRVEERKKLEQEKSKLELSGVGTERLSDSNTSNTDESDDSSDTTEYETVEVPTMPAQRRRSRPPNIISSELASALDRTKTSDRNATYVLVAAAESLGHNPSDIALNRESIRRARR